MVAKATRAAQNCRSHEMSAPSRSRATRPRYHVQAKAPPSLEGRGKPRDPESLPGERRSPPLGRLGQPARREPFQRLEPGEADDAGQDGGAEVGGVGGAEAEDVADGGERQDGEQGQG